MSTVCVFTRETLHRFELFIIRHVFVDHVFSGFPRLQTQQQAQAFIDSLERALFLCRLATQRLHRDHSPSHFVIPQDQGKLCAASCRPA